MISKHGFGRLGNDDAMSFRVVKYELPTIVVSNAWGRMGAIFLVGEDGTVQDRGSQDGLAEFRRAAVRYLQTHREVVPRRGRQGPAMVEPNAGLRGRGAIFLTFSAAPKIANIRSKFSVHPGNPGFIC
jgi:hypothetical protein